MKIQVPYPEAAEEIQLLVNVQNGFDATHLEKINIVPVEPAVLEQAQEEVAAVKVQEALFAYIVEIVRRTRGWPALSLGSSPRAAVEFADIFESHGRHGWTRLPDT